MTQMPCVKDKRPIICSCTRQLNAYHRSQQPTTDDDVVASTDDDCRCRSDVTPCWLVLLSPYSIPALA